MSIAANKVKGIRCALVHDTFSARATREHNDTNMLSMGERVIGGALLLLIGIQMIYSSFRSEEEAMIKPVGFGLIVFSLSVSLDSFSAGLSFGMIGA